MTTNLVAHDQPTTANFSAAGAIASLTVPDADEYFTTMAGINPAAPLAFPACDSCAWSAIDAEPSLVTSANASTFNPAWTVLQSLSMAVCGSCHIDTASRAHFASNPVAPIDEGCNTCHGPRPAHEANRQGGNSDSTGRASPYSVYLFW